jgi:hypothetical protein
MLSMLVTIPNKPQVTRSPFDYLFLLHMETEELISTQVSTSNKQ